MEAIAEILRGLLAAAGPDAAAMAAQLPDVALVGAAGGAGLLVLVILFAVIGAAAGGGKKKRRQAEARAERQAARPEPRAARAPEPAKTRAPEPARARAPEPKKAVSADPIQKMERNAAATSDRVRREAEEIKTALAAERTRAGGAEAPFALVVPTEALRLLAEGLVTSSEPARSAARRKLAAQDFDGARADLRRQAEGAASAGAWRDLGALEAFKDIAKAVEAFERARKLDERDFVALVTLRRLYSGVGRLPDARAAAKAAVEAARNDRERAIAFDELGENCMHERDMVGAQAAYEQGLYIVRQIAEKSPGDMSSVRDLAVSHFKLASVGGRTSSEHLAKSVEAFEKMKAAGALDAADAEVLQKLRVALNDQKQTQQKKA